MEIHEDSWFWHVLTVAPDFRNTCWTNSSHVAITEMLASPSVSGATHRPALQVSPCHWISCIVFAIVSGYHHYNSILYNGYHMLPSLSITYCEHEAILSCYMWLPSFHRQWLWTIIIHHKSQSINNLDPTFSCGLETVPSEWHNDIIWGWIRMILGCSENYY